MGLEITYGFVVWGLAGVEVSVATWDIAKAAVKFG